VEQITIKKLCFLIVFFLLWFLFQPFFQKAEAQKLAAPACSGYYGKFTATNWPGKSKVTVTCEGAGRKRGECVGQSATLSPGQSYTFSHCNCLDKSMACITVTGLPKGCKLKTKLACAANRQSVQDNVTIACDKKSATPVDSNPDSDSVPGAACLVRPKANQAPGTANPQPSTPPPPQNPDNAASNPGTTDVKTYSVPPWYCLALGENVSDWVGCKKKAL
jgi:hypothetical protein